MGLQPGNWYFSYKFAQKWYIPLSDFTQFGSGRESQICTLVPNFTVVALKNVSLQPPKSWKMLILGINFPLRENSGAPQKKLNILARLQTFLYAMTSLLFWKLNCFIAFPLLQIAWQTNKKHHTFSSTAGARPTYAKRIVYNRTKQRVGLRKTDTISPPSY